MKWSTYRESFNTQLTTYLQEQIDTLDPYCFDDTIKDTLRYLIPYSQGGKRIRPYLVYVFYQAFGGTTQDVSKLCLAVELVHLFALVHDDIMDKGTTRHSQPTFHTYVTTLYNNPHVGESQAILIGDILSTWANELVACNQSIPYTTKQIFFDLLKEVTFGQMIDVHLSHTDWTTDPKQIQRKDKMKSGYYTFMRPIMLGVSLTGNTNLEAVKTLGANLGLAFQMRDDLLDIIDHNTNKTYFSDLQEGNQTIIWDEVFKNVSAEDKAMILSYRGQHITPSQQQEIYQKVVDSGAIETTKGHINALLDQSTHDLTTLITADNPMFLQIKDVIDFMRV